MKVFVNVLGPRSPDSKKPVLSPVSQGPQSSRTKQAASTVNKKRAKKHESVEDRVREQFASARGTNIYE